MNSKKDVDGIILILSCYKHLNTRLKKFKLSKNKYLNWEVIYIVGDLSQDLPYILKDDNMLYIKCEDSYIHLLKKLALSIKYVSEIYNIKEGILRCGDDLLFDESKLIDFLKIEKKEDYWGYNKIKRNNLPKKSQLRRRKRDMWMINYYRRHLEDFSNPNHGLKDFTIKKLAKYMIRPSLFGAVGTIYYISKKSSNIIVNELEKINLDIFHFDTFSKSYPYTLEDVGVSYIMYSNNIKFINSRIFVDCPGSICSHTNFLN